jgi:2-polyprenyl-3-methyl-5-hydroxy-6-metoxy-1,4-benzoquinol methylase
MNKYTYRFGQYPMHRQLEEDVIKAAVSLEKKLAVLKIMKLDLSEYNIRYFGEYIETEEKRFANLTRYSFILIWVLSLLDKPKDEIVFLDHGGGHGMLSLLAKEYGIGTVLHNDIYPVSCKDAKKIGSSLNIEADEYISGDIDTVLDYLAKNNKVCDAIANYDVIEHVYDIDDFLKKIHLLSPGTMGVFLGSAANERNPRINRQLQAMQRKFEYKDRRPKFGRKPTDATRAVIELRKEIISEYLPELTNEEIEKFTHLTRGLIVDDIHQILHKYKVSGVYPDSPSHPTNVCDPYTGNWFEHLMNPDDLVETLNSTGFQTEIKCGYYDQPNNYVNNKLKLLLNFVIRTMGSKGLFFAPYFVLLAKK